MCGCSAHQSQPSPAAERDPAALALRVEDMTCGHCAGVITKAIETGLPGAKVEADPTSKIVLVRGTSDLPKVQSLIADAGYTPGAA
jgi:copper chaperone